MDLSPLENALRKLPHGPEFRFVDELLELEPGRKGKGCYRVRGEAPFLAGHFPGDPLLPAVLMIEAMAQLAGVVAQSDPAISPMSNLRLTAVRGVKIVGTARPGDEIEIEAHVQGRLGGLVQATGKITLKGQVLAEGQVTLSGVQGSC